MLSFPAAEVLTGDAFIALTLIRWSVTVENPVCRRNDFFGA